MDKNDQHNIHIFTFCVPQKKVWTNLRVSNDLNYWVNYLFKHFMPRTEKTQKLQLKAESYWVQHNFSQVLQCIYKYFKTVTFCGMSSKPYLLPQENINAWVNPDVSHILSLQLSTPFCQKDYLLSYSLFSLNKKHLRSPSGANHTYCLCLSSPQG